jgi:hypothetical protein
MRSALPAVEGAAPSTPAPQGADRKDSAGKRLRAIRSKRPIQGEYRLLTTPQTAAPRESKRESARNLENRTVTSRSHVNALSEVTDSGSMFSAVSVLL